ncbi:MAG: pilus assembly protein [Chloroflexi bacterium]|nr:pilus assembly protein [Chloroflexota bacterium]
MHFLRRRSERHVSRGQAMVELAIVLPVLALLLVMAIDFGRVFFGWVSITNAARIGADYAAQYPDAWATNNAAQKADFERLIRNNNGGCSIGTIADPTFADTNADGRARESGDHANVRLECTISMLTPLAGTVVGGVVTVGADSTFPIRAGDYTGPAGGGGGNPPCSGVRVPDLRLMTVSQATQFWTDSGFTTTLTASPAGQPDYIVQTQTLTPSANVNDCVDPSTSVFVTATAPPPCPSGQAQVPQMVGMLLPEARAAWAAAGFGGGFNPANGNNTKAVVTQTTGPTQVQPGGCLNAASGSVTVTYGDPPPPQCNVPNMVGQPSSTATTMWSGSGFTRSLTVQGPAGIVRTQDPLYPSLVACDFHGSVRTN